VGTFLRIGKNRRHGGRDKEMARNYTALPHEYLEEMSGLSDEEWGRLTRGLLHYSITGEEPVLSGNERFFWIRVRNRETGLQQHYQELAVKRSRAGKKGASARWGASAERAEAESVNRDAEELAKFFVKTSGTGVILT